MKLLKSIVGYAKKLETILRANREEEEARNGWKEKKVAMTYPQGGNDTVKSITMAGISYRDLRFGLTEMIASFIIGVTFAFVSLVMWLLVR